MKKLALAMALFLVLSQASAFQQYAGPIHITVPVGSSNSANYSVINNENETISVSFSFEGELAEYAAISPNPLLIPPDSTGVASITASLPSGYEGGNITGHLLASMAPREQGTVMVVLALRKEVWLIPVRQPLVDETPYEEPSAETNNRAEPANEGLGYWAYGIIALLLAVLLLFLFKKSLEKKHYKARKKKPYKARAKRK